MKKLVFAVAMAAAMAATAEMKVGYVDMLLLVRNHPNYDSNKALLASTDKDYQKKLAEIKSEGEKLQNDGKQLMDQMRNPMLTAKAKVDTERQIEDIQKKLSIVAQRLQSESMRCRQDLQDLEGRLLRTTTDDLRKRLGIYAKKNGYDFICDANAVPFAKPEYDVTNEMLREMGVDPKDARGRDEGK